MVFPLIKLGSLFVKSAVKPVSRTIALYAKSNRTFANGCHKMANSYVRVNNRCCQTLNIPYKMSQMSKEESIHLGSQMLGEGVVIGAAALLIYFEYDHRSTSSSKHEDLDDAVDELKVEISKLKSLHPETFSNADIDPSNPNHGCPYVGI